MIEDLQHALIRNRTRVYVLDNFVEIEGKTLCQYRGNSIVALNSYKATRSRFQFLPSE